METEIIVKTTPREFEEFFSNDNKDDYIVKMFDVKDNRGSKERFK